VAPYRLAADGIVLEVRLTPGASRDGIDGVKVLSDGRAVAAIRVRAVPDSCAANRALCALLAETLGVPKASVGVISGTTARRKRVHIPGEPAMLARIVDAWPRTG
jgi:uncharacterized protein (TIGR00251 family)